MTAYRIAIASSGLGHVARGIEAWAADLAGALAERGRDVALFKGSGRAAAAYERVLPCWQRDARVTQLALATLPRRASWRLGLGNGYDLEQTTFAWKLIGELRRGKFDVLHVQDPQAAFLVQRAWQLGWLRTRTVLGHGTEEPLEFQKKIAFLQHLAPWHLEEAQAAGVSRPTWTAIPNFIDTARFAPRDADRFAPGQTDGDGGAVRDELGIPRDAVVVLSVAAIKRPHKRIDYLVQEFGRLRERRAAGLAGADAPVWLVVAGGSDEESAELIAWGREQLGERVRFLPNYPRERMPELYRAADLFVLCSLKEMMPIALLEASASGLACLVNRHPVVEWMVGPGGMAIDMEAEGALAAALEETLADRARLVALGREARRHCEQHFSRDAVVDQIEAYYAEVLSAPAGRSRGVPRSGSRAAVI